MIARIKSICLLITVSIRTQLNLGEFKTFWIFIVYMALIILLDKDDDGEIYAQRFK